MRPLVVHGYDAQTDTEPGELNMAVCRMVANCHHDYNSILVVGGQHKRGPTSPVADIQYNVLLRLGVPESKLFPYTRVCSDRRPPRDTMEEVWLAGALLRALGFTPRATSFDVACIWFFRWRIEFLYRYNGAAIGKILSAPSLDAGRMGAEVVAYAATRRSPTGKLAIFDKIRKQRNVFPMQPDGQLWVDNGPQDWD